MLIKYEIFYVKLDLEILIAKFKETCQFLNTTS